MLCELELNPVPVAVVQQGGTFDAVPRGAYYGIRLFHCEQSVCFQLLAGLQIRLLHFPCT